jgi:hypothetical protein
MENRDDYTVKTLIIYTIHIIMSGLLNHVGAEAVYNI